MLTSGFIAQGLRGGTCATSGRHLDVGPADVREVDFLAGRMSLPLPRRQ